MIYIQIFHVFLIFQNFWRSRSMIFIQIDTDCSVLDRFCFCLHSCLFWLCYGLYRGYKPWRSYNTVPIMNLWNFNQFTTVLKVCNMFLILTDLTRFCWVLRDWSFQVLGEITMDEGIRSGKSLRLGMPEAPQGNIQGRLKRLSLGSPGRHPLFLLPTIGNFTWSYIFIRHMICVLLGASCIIWVFALFAF